MIQAGSAAPGLMVGREPSYPLASMRGGIRTAANDSLLLLTAAIWGFAFVAQRAGMEHVGPFLFNGIRFALGSASLLPLVLWRRSRGAGDRQRQTPVRRSLVSGLALGLVLFVAASLQQVGLVWTTAGKGGFITGLYVVLVPISGLLWRQRPGALRWAAAALAAVGLYLLSVTGRFTMQRGDLLVLVSAVFWAAHVQLIAYYAPRGDTIVMASVQFAVTALGSLAVAVVSEPLVPQAILDAALPILYGGLGSVGVAYTLQMVAQRTAHPTHAAVLLSLEGVFAALGGGLLLGETLSARSLVGCGLMLTGMLASQLGTGSRGSRPAQP